MQDLYIQTNLVLNSVFQGDDVFIHGFRLPNNKKIEDFSETLFKEGLKKQPRNSILSTIALLRHNQPLDTQITNYVLHGKYRVVLKIPTEINGLFLGNCKQKYGDAGNQYSENSVLDFLNLEYIPTEFIVGIFYTEKESYNDGEKIEFKFIQNPNFYDHLKLGISNSKNLTTKIETALKKLEIGKPIVEHILKGKEIPQSLIDNIKGYDIINKYQYFIEQRAEYDNAKTSNNSL